MSQSDVWDESDGSDFEQWESPRAQPVTGTAFRLRRPPGLVPPDDSFSDESHHCERRRSSVLVAPSTSDDEFVPTAQSLSVSRATSTTVPTTIKETLVPRRRASVDARDTPPGIVPSEMFLTTIPPCATRLTQVHERNRKRSRAAAVPAEGAVDAPGMQLVQLTISPSLKLMGDRKLITGSIEKSAQKTAETIDASVEEDWRNVIKELTGTWSADDDEDAEEEQIGQGLPIEQRIRNRLDSAAAAVEAFFQEESLNPDELPITMFDRYVRVRDERRQISEQQLVAATMLYMKALSLYAYVGASEALPKDREQCDELSIVSQIRVGMKAAGFREYSHALQHEIEISGFEMAAKNPRCTIKEGVAGDVCLLLRCACDAKYAHFVPEDFRIESTGAYLAANCLVEMAAGRIQLVWKMLSWQYHPKMMFEEERRIAKVAKTKECIENRKMRAANL